MRRPIFVAFIACIISTRLSAAQITLDLAVSITSKMINAVDQSSYPFTPDPAFMPFQMQAQVVFDNNLLSTDLLQDGASISFGPKVTLYSPITNSLHYGPENPSNSATVQSFDYTAYYGPSFKGSYIDFGQSSNRNPSPTDLLHYDWAILSPTMDPRYPPLANPALYGTSELMAFLQLLRDDGTSLSYAEISYEMLNLTSSQSYYGTYYPYAEWYAGQATLVNITTDAEATTPEPGTVSAGIGLLALGIMRWLKRTK